MQNFLASGGKRLEGEVTVQGAKNAVLPVIAAATLCTSTITVKNAPDITDTYSALRILSHLGAKTEFSAKDNTIVINGEGIHQSDIPDDLMKKIRS
jgi:UDP-N-acetylglucosamine 1-carboxyvinyltransferase